MRTFLEIFAVALVTGALIQLALELGTLATALAYGLLVYLVIGSWHVFRHRGEAQPKSLFEHIWKALNWPSYWGKP